MTDTVEILEFSETRGAIATALAKAQLNFAAVAKTEEGKVDSEKARYSYKYADLAGVLAATLPALNAQSLFFTQGANIRGVVVTVETMLLHESGEWMRNRFSLESKGSDAQKLGSALTYAKRYSALGILGVAPAEDDDGKGASTRDDRDDMIADLQAEMAETQAARKKFQLAVSKTLTRIIARSVPAEWQVATTRELSNDRTAVWSDLTLDALSAFFNRIGDEFPEPAKDPEKPPQTHDEFAQALAVAFSPETPADADSDPKADVAIAEAERQASIRWIEPRLAQSDASPEEVQDIAAGIRHETLAANPELDLSITYDWRELDIDELREFWKRIPKKARETAGATA